MTTIARSTPLPSVEPQDLSWWDSVDHMLNSYLVNREGKVPNEFEATIVKILEDGLGPESPAPRLPTNCDPFYSPEADKSRMENGGAYSKDHKSMVVAFVAFANYHKSDVVISPGVPDEEAVHEYYGKSTTKGGAQLLSKFDTKKLEDFQGYLFLPRVDITKLMKEDKDGNLKPGAVINVGFANPQNPSVKNLVAKSTKVKIEIVKMPGASLVARANQLTKGT